ncbi:MAG: hypothetical protein J0M04_17910 [Verrucomicrobia bacterium]|nr:hypothetical protein [Verrucomicrobiota bacterium]
MKRVLTILALGAAAAAAEPAAKQVIEKAASNRLSPLEAADMKRMAAGQPPRMVLFFTIASDSRSAWFGYSCDECKINSVHRGAPQLCVSVNFGSPFTPAALLDADDGQGARFLRDADGAIRQMSTTKETFFVTADKDAIVVDRYRNYDCAVEPDGSMKPLPGVKRVTRTEIRENKEENTKEARRFSVTGNDMNGVFRFMLEVGESKGVSRTFSEFYRTSDGGPEELVSRNTTVRTPWKEGSGYRQTLKSEKSVGGTVQLVEHVIESWQVAPDGSRKIVETQAPLAPKTSPSTRARSDSE